MSGSPKRSPNRTRPTVITNLLTNAAKYTPNGGLIYLGTRLDSKYLGIYVRDNGIGRSAEAPAAARPEGGTASPAATRRILVADDNRDSAETMRMLLQQSGHEVHVAHSGAETLEIARRVRPDVGILDIGMPDLSGYTVAERIRHEAWGKSLTLIAVTGWGQETDKRRALAAGFDHHLTKPVDPEVMLQLLSAG